VGGVGAGAEAEGISFTETRPPSRTSRNSHRSVGGKDRGHDAAHVQADRHPHNTRKSAADVPAGEDGAL
jgi:hypothetical protein